MPEAAVDEDYPPQSWENHVGLSGKLGDVKLVSEPHPMHEPPDRHLWLGIFASNERHALASFLLRQVVHGMRATYAILFRRREVC